MRLLRRLASLPADQLLLLGRSLLLVSYVRLALSLLPLPRFQHFVEARSRVAPAKHEVPVETIAWAVEAAGRRVPGATCLVDAAAGRILLARHGHESKLRIGVKKDAIKFAAHAWLEADGKVVIGAGEDPAGFTPLL